MSGGQWMVVLIVLIGVVGSIIKMRMRHRDDEGDGILPAEDRGEAGRLRDEVRTLKERVIVLERIATDRNHGLEQEIERLRDR